MTKKDLIVGRTYEGEQGRITFLGLDGTTARVRHPISLREFTMPVHKLVAHAESSDLRTYVHKRTGEYRQKQRVEPAGGKQRSARVVYQDELGRQFRVTETEWARWRANA